MKKGDVVMIEHVRSNHLDHENGIGWVAKNVNVTIIDVEDTVSNIILGR